MKSPNEGTVSVAILGKGAVELIFYLPILLAVAVYLFQGNAVGWWIASLILCYGVPSILLSGKTSLRLIFKILLSAMIGFTHTTMFLYIVEGEIRVLPLAVCSAIGAIIAARGLAVIYRGWTSSFPSTFMLVGIICYIAAQPLKLLLLKNLAAYNGVLIIGGFIAVILFFLIANERLLNHETIDTGRTPAAVASKRQNRVMMIILIIVILLLGLFRQIQKSIERFLESVIAEIVAWFNRPKEPAQPEQSPIEPPNMDMFPAEPPKEPAPWMQMLELILKIVVTVLIAAALILLLYIAGKKLYGAVQKILAKLFERNTEKRNTNDGFTDEVESLMTLTKLRDRMSGRLNKLLTRKRSAEAEWSLLTSNAERIRFLYVQFVRSRVKQGYTVQSHLTPRETAADLAQWKEGTQQPEELHSFMNVYEQARYGSKVPKDNEVARYKQQLGHDQTKK